MSSRRLPPRCQNPPKAVLIDAPAAGVILEARAAAAMLAEGMDGGREGASDGRYSSSFRAIGLIQTRLIANSEANANVLRLMFPQLQDSSPSGRLCSCLCGKDSIFRPFFFFFPGR